MLKNDNHYYMVSQNTSENKYLFGVKKQPQHLCNKPTEVYPITYVTQGTFQFTMVDSI